MAETPGEIKLTRPTEDRLMGTYHSGLDVVTASRAKQLAAELKMPEAVTIAMDDLAGACQGGLLALCVGAGP